MVGTREARRPALPRAGRGGRAVELHALGLQGIDAVGAALAYVGVTFCRREEAAAEHTAHLAVSLGASWADVADVVLGEVARARTADGGLLARSDAELRARRVLHRLNRPADGTGRPVLWFGDTADSLMAAVELVLETSGARLQVAVSSDPGELLPLVWGRRWDHVVVDHSALRRSARRAREVLAPVLTLGQRPPVVVVSDDPEALVPPPAAGPAAPGAAAALAAPPAPGDGTAPPVPAASPAPGRGGADRSTTWVPRDLRALAAACRVLPEDPLTERERDVLRAVAEGRSNEQIGRQLTLSLSTVKTYLERIHGKLGSVDRASAVAVAVRSGWI